MQAVSQSFAKKNDLPLFEHVTVPRTGALKVIMDVLGPSGTSPAHTHINKVNSLTNSSSSSITTMGFIL